MPSPNAFLEFTHFTCLIDQFQFDQLTAKLTRLLTLLIIWFTCHHQCTSPNDRPLSECMIEEEKKRKSSTRLNKSLEQGLNLSGS